jgi:molecular chaperone GrpE
MKQPMTAKDNKQNKTVTKQEDKNHTSVKKEPEVTEPNLEEKDLLSELSDKLETSIKEAKESYDRFLRVSAEFENYKKRSAREAEDFRKFANDALVKELLPVVDNLERALNSSKENTNSETGILEGVHITLNEILKVFEKFGVRSFDSVDKAFDPSFHQAVIQEETEDKNENIVLKELQKGYLMHNRLLRPSMVVVSKSVNKT